MESGAVCVGGLESILNVKQRKNVTFSSRNEAAAPTKTAYTARLVLGMNETNE